MRSNAQGTFDRMCVGCVCEAGSTLEQTQVSSNAGSCMHLNVWSTFDRICAGICV
jgi:hypothetical protein